MTKKTGSDKFEKEPHILRFMSIGIEFCLIIGFFAFLGHLADKHFGEGGPWFMVAGFFVGFIVMIYWLIKSTEDMQK